jgi:protein O-GlcNAc transferase
MTPTLSELLARGQRTEVEQLARQRLSKAPRDWEALAALASVQLDQGKPDAARSTLALANEADRARWELRWVAARLEAATGEPDTAEALLRRLWKEQPDRAEVAHALGTFLASQGRHGDAKPLLQRAVELAPERWPHHFALASTLLELRETQAGVDALRQVLRLNPRHATSYTMLARVLMFQGQRDEAKRLLEGALPTVDQPALVEGLMGSLLASNGAFSEGLALLDRALGALPDHAGFNADKARVLLSLGRVDQLRAFCEALERTGRASTSSRLALAEALEVSQPQEALALYRQVVATDPTDWLAANAAGLLLLRGPAPSSEAMDEARELFELAFDRSGGQVEPALNYAMVLGLSGEIEDSLYLARQVVAVADEGPIHDEAQRLIQMLGDME